MQIIKSLLLVSILGLVLVSCEESTNVGTGLLESESIDVGYRDDFDIIMTQQGSDSLWQNGVLSALALGQLSDSDYGTISNNLYTIPLVSGDSLPALKGDIVLDSVSLMLETLPDGYYGDANSRFDIEIFETTQDITTIDSFYTGASFDIASTPIGSLVDININVLDSVQLYNDSGVAFFVENIVSVPLSPEFGQRMYNFFSTRSDDQPVTDELKGLYIKVASSNAQFLINQTSVRGGLVFHYRTDTISRTTIRRFDGTNSWLQVLQNQDNSVLAQSIGSSNLEQYVALGYNGGFVEVDLTDVLNFEEAVINHSTLDLTADLIGIDTSQFAPPVRLSLFNLVDGRYELITNNSSRVSTTYTTSISSGDTFDDAKYIFNITDYVTQLIAGEVEPKIYISLPFPLTSPNKVLFFGPNHPSKAAKLSITFTKL